MKEKKITIYQITFMALMAAIICVLGPISIPVGPVPISLTNMVIVFTVTILGVWAGTGSYCLYLLLGLVGIPVFSGYTGGLGKLAGPTGGYLIGFIFMAIIGGAVMEKTNRKLIPSVIGWIAGCAVDYVFGTIWFVIIAGSAFSHALAICVYPFIIGDIVKIVVGVLLGKELHKALNKSGILSPRKKTKKAQA